MWTSKALAARDAEIAQLRERCTSLQSQLSLLRCQFDALERKHDRLVTSRLYRTGDLSQPLEDAPPAPPNPLQHVMRAFGRMELTQPPREAAAMTP